MIRLGTRASPLARTQAEQAARFLRAESGEQVRVVPLSSLGDEDTVRPLSRFLEQGAFTGRLDRALLDDEVDVAVHSLKDVPLTPLDGLTRPFVPQRADPRDLLLVHRDLLDDATAEPGSATSGATAARLLDDPMRLDGRRIGTSAPRRRSQLLDQAPTAVPVDLRGSIETRIRRLAEAELDGLFLAKAADDRGRPDHPDDTVAVPLPLDRFPTAAGQGALALQTRTDDAVATLLAAVEDADAATAVATERGLLADLGGGCGLPLGATCVPAPVQDTPDTPDTSGWTLHVTYVRRPQQVPAVRLHRATFTGDDPSTIRRHAFATLQGQDDTPRPIGASSVPGAGASPRRRGDKVLLVAEPPTEPDVWALLLAGAGHTVTRWWPYATQETAPAPGDTLVSDWESASWCLVTSARAVPTLARLEALRPDPRKRIAAVGPATARALHAHGLAVTLVPQEAKGEAAAAAILRRLGDDAAGTVVLWPTQSHAVDTTTRRLEEAGAVVRRHHVYTVTPAPDAPPPALEGVAAVLFTSPRTVRTALARLSDDARRALVQRRVLAIGPSTAAALEACGIDAETLPRPTPSALRLLLESPTTTPGTPGA